jgi:hypothetical protein
MITGRLASIRWVPPDRPLSAKAAKNPIARMLAATGVPTTPFGMTVRDEVIYFLQAIAEVEHSLLIQYLYAWFSLDASKPLAKGWADTVKTIAIQEMAHLITVQNMLVSIGAEPYLDRGRLYQGTIPFELAPFAEVPLARFITTESPMPSQIPAGKKRDTVEQISRIAESGVSWTGTPVTIQHVGTLYVYLYWLVLPTDTSKGPWKNFPTEPLPAGRHLSPADFRGLDSKLQTSLDEWPTGVQDFIVQPVRSAKPNDDNGPLSPIYKISLQGEGWEDTDESHFNKFLKMWQPLQTQITQGKSFALGMASSPSVDPSRPRTRTITNQAAAAWARLFNTRYQMLLLKIWLGLSKPSDDPDTGPAGRAQLFGQAVALEMQGAVTLIAKKLRTLPLKPRPATPSTDPVELAGPPFELPAEALPNRPKGQVTRLIELIDQTAAQINALNKLPAGDPDRPTAADVNDILKPLSDDDGPLKTALKALLPTLP